MYCHYAIFLHATLRNANEWEKVQSRQGKIPGPLLLGRLSLFSFSFSLSKAVSVGMKWFEAIKTVARSPPASSHTQTGCSIPTKEKWCMNLIELKWNGFLHPFAFKFERHKKM
jgi:hypothetical protein